jgi:hypothetical protein
VRTHVEFASKKFPPLATEEEDCNPVDADDPPLVQAH